jgi:glycine dehydrogenase subunit 2
MKQIAREIAETPELVKSAPHNTPIGRLDDVKAVKQPKLRYGGVCG